MRTPGAPGDRRPGDRRLADRMRGPAGEAEAARRRSRRASPRPRRRLLLDGHPAHLQPLVRPRQLPHGAVPAQGQDLNRGVAYGQLVNVSSTEQPKLKRVKPGEPNNSYLVRKIQGGPNISGVLMPNGLPGCAPNGAQCLTPDEIAAIVQWVTECAPNN